MPGRAAKACLRFGPGQGVQGRRQHDDGGVPRPGPPGCPLPAGCRPNHHQLLAHSRTWPHASVPLPPSPHTPTTHNPPA